MIEESIKYYSGEITLDQLYHGLQVYLTEEGVKYTLDYAPNNFWDRKTTGESDIFVVANAHHDTLGHIIWGPDEYEKAEEKVTELFDEPDDTEWNVSEDSYWLDNEVSDPESNGYATQIEYGGG
ncbi:MAG: hypothetical protein SVM80_12975 [Halobacteriota archaeon]|nr:hypothetical protein [Halobacteriota archaeon]